MCAECDAAEQRRLAAAQLHETCRAVAHGEALRSRYPVPESVPALDWLLQQLSRN